MRTVQSRVLNSCYIYLIIYARDTKSSQQCRDGITETTRNSSQNGQTHQELFVVWLHHFAKFARPSSAEPILPVLDNPYGHIPMGTYKFCEESFIVVLFIPPHTSHRMQSLDEAFHGLLKIALLKKCHLFMENHALKKITPYDVASIFEKVFCSAAIIKKAVL